MQSSFDPYNHLSYCHLCAYNPTASNGQLYTEYLPLAYVCSFSLLWDPSTYGSVANFQGFSAISWGPAWYSDVLCVLYSLLYTVAGFFSKSAWHQQHSLLLATILQSAKSFQGVSRNFLLFWNNPGSSSGCLHSRSVVEFGLKH
eukprot:c53664_g1_i1 orf=666-1097(-)